jgi:DNA-directed RNA polymerase specialized sigma subunit
MDERQIEFWELYCRLLQYPLSIREMNYLIWRFYNHKSDEEIARLDGRRISRQEVNRVIQRAYKKIKNKSLLC